MGALACETAGVLAGVVSRVSTLIALILTEVRAPEYACGALSCMQLIDLPEDEKEKVAAETGAPSALPKIISTGFKVGGCVRAHAVA